MKKNNRKGFTIVELVIVIAVIAILAAVLIPTFSNMVSKANDSAALQEARNTYTDYIAENASAMDEDSKVAILVDDQYFLFEGGKVNDTPVAKEDFEAANGGTDEPKTYADYVVYCSEHDWDSADGKCKNGEGKCSALCEHEWGEDTGKCTVCEYECGHDYADDAADGTACGICGMEKPAEQEQP